VVVAVIVTSVVVAVISPVVEEVSVTALQSGSSCIDINPSSTQGGAQAQAASSSQKLARRRVLTRTRRGGPIIST
jgi:hypothetical protein